MFALVAICSFIATVRAGSGNIPVCQELTSFLVVILLAILLGKLVFIIERAEKVGRCFTMYIGSGAGVNIEGDSKLGE